MSYGESGPWVLLHIEQPALQKRQQSQPGLSRQRQSRKKMLRGLPGNQPNKRRVQEFLQHGLTNSLKRGNAASCLGTDIQSDQIPLDQVLSLELPLFSVFCFSENCED